MKEMELAHATRAGKIREPLVLDMAQPPDARTSKTAQNAIALFATSDAELSATATAFAITLTYRTAIVASADPDRQIKQGLTIRLMSRSLLHASAAKSICL
jgi:hypothetical protein